MEHTIMKLTWGQVMDAVHEVTALFPRETKYYGVPRGGCYIAALTKNPVDSPEEADVIIDDIIDSGRTQERYKELYPEKPFIAPYVLKSNNEQEAKKIWIVFPWEQEPITDIQDNYVRILQAHGKDVNEKNVQKIAKLIEHGITKL